MNPFLRSAMVVFPSQWLGFLVSAPFQSEKIYDLVGCSAFILTTWITLMSTGTFYPRQVVISMLVTIWGTRLGLYLLYRMLKAGRDKRFDGYRDRVGYFFFFWTMNGVWVFLTTIPAVMLNSDRANLPLGPKDFFGWGIWVLGFVIETLADHQKSEFRNQPQNKDKYISHGLWKQCRHPNYLGEIMMWIGIYVSVSSVFSGWQYLSVGSPLFLAFALIKMSGIPPLEEAGLKKWGKNAAYQKYIKNTAQLIPHVW